MVHVPFTSFPLPQLWAQIHTSTRFWKLHEKVRSLKEQQLPKEIIILIFFLSLPGIWKGFFSRPCCYHSNCCRKVGDRVSSSFCSLSEHMRLCSFCSFSWGRDSLWSVPTTRTKKKSKFHLGRVRVHSYCYMPFTTLAEREKNPAVQSATPSSSGLIIPLFPASFAQQATTWWLTLSGVIPFTPSWVRNYWKKSS